MHNKIDRQKQNIAKKYFLSKFYISKINTLVSLIFGLLIIFTGISAGLSIWSKNISSVRIIYTAIYFLALFTLFYIISIPFSYINSFKTEHKYNFSNQSLKEWVIDSIKSYSVSLILGLIVMNTIYFIIVNSPDFWWFWLGIALLFYSVILQHLAPVLLIPIFYKLHPLEDEDLKQKLYNLAEKAKVKIIGIYTIDLSQKTKKANAALTGLGKTRRILLGDTLIDDYDKGEIETVIAHELGHHIHKHIPKLILIQGSFTMISAFILFKLLPGILNYLNQGSVSNINSFPVLVITAGFISFFTNPINLWISRVFESQSDDTALKLSQKPKKFISTMCKFANQYLSYANPPKIIKLFEFSHPPISERIQKAEEFESANK
ncbi:MAG: M48 family metallopeptidase [Elusimicrobiota bacterium]